MIPKTELQKRAIPGRWISLVVATVIATGMAGIFHPRHTVLGGPDVTGAVILLGGSRILRSSPAAADFNGDGLKEIVVATSDGRLFVIGWVNGWTPVWSRQVALDINAANPPNPISMSPIQSAIAIADLDRDGKLEIVVTTGGLPADQYNGGLLVYGYNSAWNFSIKGNWPQPRLDVVGGGPTYGNPDGFWDGIFSSPAVGDLDGDGDLEIVWEGEDRRIHAYHHTGNVVGGWPFYRWPPNLDPLDRGGISSPALGDIDNDGLVEVIVGGTSPRCTPSATDGCGAGTDYSVAPVWAINGDSTLVPGWPKYVPTWVDSSPALGNIDGDEQLEVIVGSGRSASGIGGNPGGYQVFAWNGDGSPVSGWPKATAYLMPSSPALADLNGGGLDVIIGCGTDSDVNCSYLYAWQGNGSAVPGFPMFPLDINDWPGGHQPMSQPFPVVAADIDGDGKPEILTTGTPSMGVTVIESNGSMSTDYSRSQQSPGFGIYASLLVADVDHDGLLETVAAGEANGQAAVYIWNEVGPASAGRTPWPMFRHDNRRTGNYCFTETPPANPTGFSATPSINTRTADNTITIDWSGASASGCAGLSGYSIQWSASATTIPDTVQDTAANRAISPALSNGTWWFHIRARDRWGNWSNGAGHYGPFLIARSEVFLPTLRRR